MADLREIVEFLDVYLDLQSVPDYPGAHNGLQVDSRSPVEKICVATDACQATIDGTVEAGAQFLLVHHGMFWGDPLPVVGITYRRLRSLIENDVALYSAHLPLDVHSEVGNNVRLAAAMNLSPEGSFGSVMGHDGFGIWAATDLSLAELARQLERACGACPRVIQGGPEHVRRVGIVTGSAASLLSAAHAEGLDTFITGEGSHATYHEALELGVNLVYGGHYATETLGVKALGQVLADRFGVEWSFLDVPTGM